MYSYHCEHLQICTHFLSQTERVFLLGTGRKVVCSKGWEVLLLLWTFTDLHTFPESDRENLPTRNRKKGCALWMNVHNDKFIFTELVTESDGGSCLARYTRGNRKKGKLSFKKLFCMIFIYRVTCQVWRWESSYEI